MSNIHDPEKRCRVCGCTEAEPCVDIRTAEFTACAWAAPNLCDYCAEIIVALAEFFLVHMNSGPLDERIIERVLREARMAANAAHAKEKPSGIEVYTEAQANQFLARAAGAG